MGGSGAYGPGSDRPPARGRRTRHRRLPARDRRRPGAVRLRPLAARRLYGDTFDALWGELAPVPRENVHVVGERVLGFDCFPTPGHASHHVCYLGEDGTLYAGDAAGVRIQPHPTVLPPTPPPEFDLDAWLRTLDEIERRTPARLALIHFGVAADVERHLDELRVRLADWVARTDAGVTEEEFSESVRADVGSGLEEYERAMPFWQ